MLGSIIDRLEEPEVAAATLRALDLPGLDERLAALGAGRPPAEVLAATVRGFLETASDEQWLQLIGLMGRSEDPGLAALRAIVQQALRPPACACDAR